MEIIFERPQKTYKGYIFDCDGTLADSMPLHLEAWNAGLRAAQAPFVLDSKGFMNVAGMAMQQTIDHWNEEHATKIDIAVVMAAKTQHFRAHQDERIKPIEPVVAYAREMAEQGLPLSVASGGNRIDVNHTLELIGVADLFQVVVTADDVRIAKPAPDIFLLAAERMGVDPRGCVVFEDSDLGIQAAETAGMDWVRIPPRFPA